MKNINIKYNCLLYASMAYIYTPVLLFVFGWLKIGYAAITCLACAICLFRLKNRNVGPRDAFSVDPIIIVFAVLFFAWIGYYAGYGRFVDQSLDWGKHNAVLADLVNRSWPVIYSNGNEHSMLTYYIGQYLVPAAIGKVMHSVRIAELALYAWNIAGLVLVFLNILFFTRAESFIKQLLYTFAIPLFSIPLWFSEWVLKAVSGFNTIGNQHWFYFAVDEGIMLQYSSNYVLLRWVFAQVIPIWLMVIVFLIHRDKIEYYVIILLPTVLFGTLTFLGVFPLAAGAAIENLCKNRKLKKWVQQIFSMENVIAVLTLGVVLFLYLYGNVTGEKPSGVGFKLTPYTKSTWIVYLVFVGVNILPYALILFKAHMKDSVYYAMILSLLILPFFKMGKWNDLIMRASIPGLFVLMIYVIENMEELIKHYNRTITTKIALLVTVMFLIIGTYYPFTELSDSVKDDKAGALGKEGWRTLEDYANRSLEDVEDDVKYNYYSYDIENNIFCRYMMK